jgi:acetyl-CoA synthetase
MEFKIPTLTFGVPPHSGYGSTEAGAIIYQYAGFKNWVVKPGSLGKPMPGIDIGLLDKEGNEVPQGPSGEIAMKRRGQWFRVKDAAVMDEDGYYWHKGRVDDVIISAGWTISPTEVENAIQKHPAVLEVAVVGVPDKDRGLIVKAFILPKQEPGQGLKEDIQNFVKEKLSKHEYPREIEFVKSFPKTEGGKIKREELKKRAVVG